MIGFLGMFSNSPGCVVLGSSRRMAWFFVCTSVLFFVLLLKLNNMLVCVDYVIICILDILT